MSLNQLIQGYCPEIQSLKAKFKSDGDLPYCGVATPLAGARTVINVPAKCTANSIILANFAENPGANITNFYVVAGDNKFTVTYTGGDAAKKINWCVVG